jgi:hypothetical protein
MVIKRLFHGNLSPPLLHDTRVASTTADVGADARATTRQRPSVVGGA